MPENDPARTDSANLPEDQQKVTGSPDAGDANRADPAVENQAAEVSAVGNPALEDRGVDAVVETNQEDLRAELEEAKDRALRSQAELENYRKRVARLLEEERRYASLPVIRDLLPVWDNMGRAIEAAQKANQTDSLLKGFSMVIRQLEDVLARHHCTRIEALGEPFDPHLHEAISQQPSAEHPPGTVTCVAQTGFQLHDRVVRPSQVIVSAAVTERTAEADRDARKTRKPSRKKGPQATSPEAECDQSAENEHNQNQSTFRHL